MIIFFTSLCWGSFLNMLAYRLLHDKSLFTMRSVCPSCNHVIAWYDNIPLVSWFVLRGQCRFCKASISWLYPFTELATATVLTFLYMIVIPTIPDIFDYTTFGLYAIFMSALIASTRTDLEAMLIPQAFTLWLVPLGFIAAWFDLINIFLIESLMGAFIGYAMLLLVAIIFKRTTGKEGLGIGDMELLALIGAFLGPIGVWISVLVASVTGLTIGSLYLFIYKKNRSTRIPFGPFLALGAVCYFFFQPYFQKILIG